MLRLNLKKGQPIVTLRPMGLLVAGFLLFGILVQGFLYIQKSGEQATRHDEIEALKAHLQALQARKRELAKATDGFEAMNGAVVARNDWLKRRGQSPVFLLAKFESEKPSGVELKTFESEGPRGTVKLAAGDLDTASRFMNAILGNNVRVAMDERIRSGILAVCTWND